MNKKPDADTTADCDSTQNIVALDPGTSDRTLYPWEIAEYKRQKVDETIKAEKPEMNRAERRRLAKKLRREP
jgi:hypothetical protein